MDACGLGLSALLYQEQDGRNRFISYVSQTLIKSEAKYTAHKLVFLVLKRTITDKFCEYLYGNTFEVFTDYNLLTYVLTSAKLDATGHRWVAGLGNYNFGIHCKSEKTNVYGDALSRIPWNTTLEHDLVQAIIKVRSEDYEALNGGF